MPSDSLLVTSSLPPSSDTYSLLSNTPIPIPADLVDSKWLEKPLTNELFAHTMPGIFYFDYRETFSPLQSNPNLAVSGSGLDRVLNEMAYHPLQTRRIGIDRKTGIQYLKNWLRFGNGFALYRLLQ